MCIRDRDSKEENYDLFYEKEINSRKVFSYPPFSKILNIGFSSEDEARLLDISKKFYDEIKSQDIEPVSYTHLYLYYFLKLNIYL